MRGQSVAGGALVLVVLLVGVQLGATTVGQPTGPHWSEPTELASIPSGEETAVLDVAVAGGDPGAVAWLARVDGTWRVRVARVAVDDGAVTVTGRWTVAESDARLVDLDVAVDGRAVAVTWERFDGNDVVLARRTPSGTTRTVVSGDPLRVEEPSVAFADGVPVVAWRAYHEGQFPVTVATVHGGRVQRQVLDAPTLGSNSPTVVATGSRVALVWADDRDGTAAVTTGALRDDGTLRFESTVTLGSARPRTGFGSGGAGSLTVGGGRNASTVRAVWTDVASVETATVRDGRVVGHRTIGNGERPGVAVDGDRWLAAWLVDRTGSGLDVVYHYGGPAAERGTLSRLPSSASAPGPLFGPGPAVAWLERGGEWRVLIAAHTDEARGGPVDRFTTAPLQFLFVGTAAALVGLLTAPILPWVLFGFVGAFLATTGFVRDRVLWAVATLAGPGVASGPAALRARLGGVPSLVWVGAFAAAETALLVWFLGQGAVPATLSFRAPVAVSAAALVATVVLLQLREHTNAWSASFLFVYLQSAGLWATVLPRFM